MADGQPTAESVFSGGAGTPQAILEDKAKKLAEFMRAEGLTIESCGYCGGVDLFARDDDDSVVCAFDSKLKSGDV